MLNKNLKKKEEKLNCLLDSMTIKLLNYTGKMVTY